MVIEVVLHKRMGSSIALCMLASAVSPDQAQAAGFRFYVRNKDVDIFLPCSTPIHLCAPHLPVADRRQF